MKTIFASTISNQNRGIMIMGASGSGKSDLCLRLIKEFDCVLVSDDRTGISAEGGELVASCPENIQGLLEVRGVGILRFPFLSPVPVKLAVKLVSPDQKIERLPVQEFYENGGIKVPQLEIRAFEASAPAKIIAALDYPSYRY